MSHRKVHSQGNVPFSWEDKPGVSKVITHFDDHKCPIDIGLHEHDPPVILSPPSDGGGSSKVLVQEKKVPPPPPCSIQPLPKRSTSVKGLRWWQEDPFLAAYKECTKNGGKNGKLWSSDQGRKNNGNGSKARKKKITFSCKNTCDVRDDNLVKLSNLPPLPKDRSRSRQEFVYPLYQKSL
ncbi:hypothetical protein COLO4_11612 [Corchorus olitorius]|uniref:Uncharacterized protein n=1 Tax=Corchorus olitorius TaxID=93759 RepID=A0A1R3K3U4_9ROSI|nr:hypothetical protein COLO4_11612 [Corchorus olitorius]